MDVQIFKLACINSEGLVAKMLADTQTKLEWGGGEEQERGERETFQAKSQEAILEWDVLPENPLATAWDPVNSRKFPANVCEMIHLCQG